MVTRTWPVYPTGIIAVAKSGNSKTGAISATYASQETCPPSCPLMGSGCYAEHGPMALHTRRVNASAIASPIKLAINEAMAISRLPGDRKLRVHVVGDCRTPMAASIVGRAMMAYQRRGGYKAWTYTHAWRDVPVANWQGAEVLASCENTAQVMEANALGYAACIVVPVHPTNKVHTLNGIKVIPCPQQFKNEDGTPRTSCARCGICMGISKSKGLTVQFAVHGNKKQALQAIS